MNIVVLSVHTASLFWFRMNMMQAFLEQGHTVFAIGSEPEAAWAQQFAQQGIVYRSIPAGRNGTNPFDDLKTYRAICARFREIKPDKVFAYQAKAIVYGAWAAHTYKVPEFYALVAGLGSIFRGEGAKAQLVRSILTVQYKLAFRESKTVIFQNEDDRTELINRGVVSREKTAMIHGSGVDLTRFTQTPVPEKLQFLFIGRLIKDKGVQEYLDACRLVRQTHPQAECVLIGPFDSNPSALRPDELAAYTQDGTVTYLGEQADVRPYLQETSVFVLPSYHEGTPKTVLEAMATGRAVITTDAPGCRETVTDGINGLLVPVKSAEAVAAAMCRLAEQPQLCRAFGAAGRKIAEEKYDVNKVNASIMQIMSIAGKDEKEYVSI